LADRINVIEGIVDDIKRGYIPNFFAERGCAADWKYNRRGLLQKALAIAAVTAIAITLISDKKK
jgi:hypothetical protein